MDFARVGNHYVSACPFCDKLFDVVMDEGTPGAIDRIQVLYEEHLAAEPACASDNADLPDMWDVMESLRPTLVKIEAERQERIDTHPDNDRDGFWFVDGIRHDATCRATSAREAIEKCSEIVGDWESPEARFIGEEMPDVF